MRLDTFVRLAIGIPTLFAVIVLFYVGLEMLGAPMGLIAILSTPFVLAVWGPLFSWVFDETAEYRRGPSDRL